MRQHEWTRQDDFEDQPKVWQACSIRMIGWIKRTNNQLTELSNKSSLDSYFYFSLLSSAAFCLIKKQLYFALSQTRFFVVHQTTLMQSRRPFYQHRNNFFSLFLSSFFDRFYLVFSVFPFDLMLVNERWYSIWRKIYTQLSEFSFTSSRYFDGLLKRYWYKLHCQL